MGTHSRAGQGHHASTGTATGTGVTPQRPQTQGWDTSNVPIDTGMGHPKCPHRHKDGTPQMSPDTGMGDPNVPRHRDGIPNVLIDTRMASQCPQTQGWHPNVPIDTGMGHPKCPHTQGWHPECPHTQRWDTPNGPIDTGMAPQCPQTQGWDIPKCPHSPSQCTGDIPNVPTAPGTHHQQILLSEPKEFPSRK